MKQDFEALVGEAEHRPFSGWDFSYLAQRYAEEKPPWNYRTIVLERMKGVNSMLDLGTGGGELLSSLQPLPKETFATESYPPNVPKARSRLEPLGVRVVQVSRDDELPFDDGFLDLIIDRHESFDAGEVFRILRSGGLFVTQQVGRPNNKEILERFHVKKGPDHWTLEKGVGELRRAGFDILDVKEAVQRAAFYDIGALVYYLKAVQDVPDFNVARYRPQLTAIHELIQAEGEFRITNYRCFIEAAKPGSGRYHRKP